MTAMFNKKVTIAIVLIVAAGGIFYLTLEDYQKERIAELINS